MNIIQGLVGIRKANNAGLAATTAGGNVLLHTLPVATTVNSAPRSAYIRKIMAYNNTGGLVTLQFGTLNRNPAGAAFVALFPLLAAINGLDNEWLEWEIPAIEFISWPALTAAGRTGDIYVLAATAAVQISLEVEEFGA